MKSSSIFWKAALLALDVLIGGTIVFNLVIGALNITPTSALNIKTLSFFIFAVSLTLIYIIFAIISYLHISRKYFITKKETFVLSLFLFAMIYIIAYVNFGSILPSIIVGLIVTGSAYPILQLKSKHSIN